MKKNEIAGYEPMVDDLKRIFKEYHLKCNDKCVTIKMIGGAGSWRKQQH